MILTLDIGNSTIGVCGVERDDGYQVVFSGRMPTVREGTDYLPQLKGLLENGGIVPEDVEGIVLSSVVPCLDAPLSRAAETLLGKTPRRIGTDRGHGLSFAIPHPEKLGLDRVADAAWTVRNYPLPAVTVDLGTATAFNVLDGDGVFLGGLIAPGLETGLHALAARTAQLPELELSGPEALIGRDTQACMRSGAVNGTAAMIDGIAARVESELGRTVTLILTGGWARLVGPACLHPHVCDPWLLPKGLALLYDLHALEPARLKRI